MNTKEFKDLVLGIVVYQNEELIITNSLLQAIAESQAKYFKEQMLGRKS